MAAEPSLWTRFMASIKNLFSGSSAPKQPVFNPEEKDGVWYQELQPGVVRVGLTPFAYQDIGGVSFMDFSTTDDAVESGDDLIELEGDKAVETLKAPVTGTIVARNNDLLKETDDLQNRSNQDNWLVDIKL
ncbi:glycine cleavage system protein H [Secundilactobacillus collinoides]|uniref:Lipoyl-binding domain-containing protein n=2 Tax=Secundilactobacillus collinoides TaxID=33960 RepID=A0A0R2BB83_SECCO|nr:glycine cleavage system protein H [Secundilactobacillus collinoides]KRM76751.1 hypothetical protein FC82_GL001100 [Secundilactobacillus collinoides DSM 20515 = JCM 1123]KZL35851.1 hypothetical protein TY91_15315 [Secundilactobacillus collinoides]